MPPLDELLDDVLGPLDDVLGLPPLDDVLGPLDDEVEPPPVAVPPVPGPSV
ncbi:Hypothetical protein A7982_04638 [Minicystis rosea]|nr:Hypothetical protein A7982_04638 [Minicystis rosea]